MNFKALLKNQIMRWQTKNYLQEPIKSFKQ